MKTRIFKDYEEFCLRKDKTENGVTLEFSEKNKNWELKKGNEWCWNCSDCSG